MDFEKVENSKIQIIIEEFHPDAKFELSIFGLK
jgi:hypothetical protein